MLRRRFGVFLIGLMGISLIAAACSSSNPSTSASGGGKCTPSDTPNITFAAYSTPREVYGKIISDFQSKWKEDHNDQLVNFSESYLGSTTQAQNVVNGFPADVVALSLAPDVASIQDAGLITHDWTDAPDGGMVSSSAAVFDVQPGNPLGIQDWNDLAKSGVEVLTPDPAASGGARWNIVGAYGAAMRGYAGNQKNDVQGAQSLLQGIFTNVIALDKSARDSIQNFESGNGNVAITYENEIFTAKDAGLPDEAVYPPSTVMIQNPVAVVDKNAEADCVEDVANAFVDYLHTKEAKDLYRTVGFLRSTDPKTAAKADKEMGFPAIQDLFTVDDLGGWDSINEKVFGDPDGVFTKAFKAAQG